MQEPQVPPGITDNDPGPGIDQSALPGVSGSSPKPSSEKERNPQDVVVGQDKSTQSSVLSSASPIKEHYLEFATELPSPVAPANTGSNLPPCPDLTRYNDPFEWSAGRKNFHVWLSVVATALTAYTAGSYSPGVEQMEEEWGVSNIACYVGITTFTCGFAVAPMVLAPFSELNGRKPVFIITGILFVACQLASGLTPTYGGMLVARFFCGCGGSTFSTMVGGLIADMYHSKDRNTPMTLFSGGVLFGTGLGPLIAGFIGAHLDWRWIFYTQTIADAFIVIVLAAFFKETRGSVLLSRKASTLNKWYEKCEAAGFYGVMMPTTSDKAPAQREPQRIRWKVKADEERSSLGVMIGISLYRPFHLLVTEPIVFWFSLWVSFAWAILYLTLAAVPLVFTTTYGFTLSENGAVFASLMVASIIGTILSLKHEALGRQFGKESSTPEGRLYFSCVESAMLPLGLFMFGWLSDSSIHWIAPTISLGIATMGIFSVYLAVFNYLADSYHRYASSALAGQSFCRNILGGAFPLVTQQMYRAMGYGGASSFLGGVGVLLTFVPWILVFYGSRIRARSKFAREIMEGRH